MKPFAEAVSSMMPENKGNSGKTREVVISGNNFVIREEADIKKVAEELYRLEKRER